jgi:uncharacterized protein
MVWLLPSRICNFAESVGPSANAADLLNNESRMNFDWTEGSLADGLRCYCNEEFFDAHEHWEAVWLKCEEPEKTFLQSLIQIAAAFHHLQKNNRRGATSLLQAALRRLEPYPARFANVEVGHLREEIRAWLLVLVANTMPGNHPYPQIRPGPLE